MSLPRTFVKMNPNQLPAKKTDGINILPDNPFRDHIIAWQKRIKVATRTSKQYDGYKRTTITIVEQSEYYPGRYTKLYHNPDILNSLGPYDALLFLYIATHMDYEAQQVLIDYKTVNMDRKRLAKSLLELTGLSIIRKVSDKKQWYWVNISIVIIGNINKEDEWQDPEYVPADTPPTT